MNDDLKRWDEDISEWAKIAKEKRTLAPELLKAELLQILGDVHNKEILDAGCGDGLFSELLTKHGARLTAVDGAPRMVELAKQLHPDLSVSVADLTQKLNFESDSFDFVICLFVVMSMNDISLFVSESKRVLKEQGRLIVCTFHPAFNFPTMKLHRSLMGKILNHKTVGIVGDYFQKTTQRQDDAAAKPWPFYHRTLTEYTKTFIQSGFKVRGIHEPHHLSDSYLAEHPKHEYATRLPRFILFDLLK